jgi:S-disulfanyl-L-cysteine oxidoreductase SoxD
MNRLIVFAATTSLAVVILRPRTPAQAQLERASNLVVLSNDARIAAHTTWDSVYTDSQAVRGDTLYKATCMKCHGETLAGSDSAVSLTGNDFQVNWDGLTLDQLYDKMVTSMPSDNPKSVPTSKMIDVLAYILSKNSFPSGKAALPDDVAVLKDIKFAKNRP